MLIEDEEASNIVLGDTTGDGKRRTGFEDAVSLPAGAPAFRRGVEGTEARR